MDDHTDGQIDQNALKVRADGEGWTPATVTEVVAALYDWSPKGLCAGMVLSSNGNKAKTVGCYVGALAMAAAERSNSPDDLKRVVERSLGVGQPSEFVLGLIEAEFGPQVLRDVPLGIQYNDYVRTDLKFNPYFMAYDGLPEVVRLAIWDLRRRYELQAMSTGVQDEPKPQDFADVESSIVQPGPFEEDIAAASDRFDQGERAMPISNGNTPKVVQAVFSNVDIDDLLRRAAQYGIAATVWPVRGYVPAGPAGRDGQFENGIAVELGGVDNVQAAVFIVNILQIYGQSEAYVTTDGQEPVLIAADGSIHPVVQG